MAVPSLLRKRSRTRVHRARPTVALAAQAFRAGFAIGADPEHAGRRTVVDPATHEHWRAGFEAGRAAADEGERAYRDHVAAKEGR